MHFCRGGIGWGCWGILYACIILSFSQVTCPPQKGSSNKRCRWPFVLLLRHDATDKHIRTCLNCVYIDQHVDIFKHPPACSSHDFKQLSSKLLLTASICYTRITFCMNFCAAWSDILTSHCVTAYLNRTGLTGGCQWSHLFSDADASPTGWVHQGLAKTLFYFRAGILFLNCHGLDVLSQRIEPD